ncbi:hypothetical protein EsDP_00006647 [Epichloe bromicola]|uniref:CCZ1/INTU/HSP4 first Longin domain-containing protein n=1 Tax=Epichloe bromicola TaxID=79588 RepID=A0ABQ0CYN8_9HYPO
MTNATAAAGAAVPAQLGFLAIFNPCLGNTDDTIDDQIVYYASETTQRVGIKKGPTRGRPTDAISQEERSERLRQIGLAQGMINFSRGFADGASLESVDTEKSRVITHELEPGWWVLASIDFTRVPLPPRLPVNNTEEQEDKYEYSSRELKPASLLLRDLLRAHSIFLMHHDTSLSALFVRNRRTKFVTAISRYWDLFLSTWNVMLHGNPVRNVFGGISIARSGELGVGVGEEQRGSGEREVLEDLVGRIEGLVDLVVSKFGTEEGADDVKGYRDRGEPQWLGTGEEPATEDGAIFLGVGALSRKSVRDVTHWMEDLYQWGDHAYGVIESPTSTRRAGRRGIKSVDERQKQAKTAEAPSATVENQEDQSRRPEEQQAEYLSEYQDKTEQKTEQHRQQPKTTQVEGPETPATSAQAGAPGESDPTEAQDGKMDTILGYMKLGYGSYWTIPGTSHTNSNPPFSTSTKPPHDASPPPPPPIRPHLAQRASSETHGHYLIGLKGSIEEDNLSESSASSDHNVRTVLRTINVELEDKPSTRPDTTIIRDFQHPGSPLTQSQVAGNMLPGYNSHDLNKSEKLRVVVYVNRPFIFTFLFRLRTDSLAWDSLYRSLHHQLFPLKKPLLASTTYRPEVDPQSTSSVANSIYNLVWDPPALTVHSSIPNIPESSSSEAWSRADAINSHLHLLMIHGLTRSKHADLERNQKTNRGWWIVWTRLLDKTAPNTDDHSGHGGRKSSDDEQGGEDGNDEDRNSDKTGLGKQHVSKEIFLLRRASDHAGFRSISTGDAAVGGAEGASKLVQGIGVDTRRYVEELLSFL